MLAWRFHSILGLAFLALLLSATRASWANGEAQAAAESLFMEGRKLMEQERYLEACQRFRDSQRLDPAAGTALNLARCYAKVGRTASAWTLFREAAALANAAQQPKREEAALHEAAALEVDLAKLVLTKAEANSDSQVLLDGYPFPASLFDVATPVDPGPHEVTVERGSEVLWRTRLQASAREVVRLKIPAFQPLRSQAPVTSNAVTQGPIPHARRPSGLQRTTAVALAAASLGAMAYAGYAAIQAKNAYAESERGCSAANQCDGNGLAARERAFDQARRADIALAFAGGAAIGAGVLWFTAGPAQVAAAGRAPRLAWAASWLTRW